MKAVKRKLHTILAVFIALCFLGILAVAGINIYMIAFSNERKMSSQEAAQLKDVDCIMVLGCQVKEGGEPSHMLRDRLQRSVETYQYGASEKLLMSGDHGRTDYNEVETMKQYAIDEGIESENIFMDHAGFSTYESIYRAKEVFGVKKMVIITQEYHL